MPGPYSSRFHGVVLCSPIGGPAPAKLLCKWPTKVGMVHSDRGGSSIIGYSCTSLTARACGRPVQPGLALLT
jgi:hypothetical protein